MILSEVVRQRHITPGAATRRYVRDRVSRGGSGSGQSRVFISPFIVKSASRKADRDRPSFCLFDIMTKYDVVYILGRYALPDELRYSLRSVCENMEYKRVWFYCGKPKGIEPDEYVPMQQIGPTKWAKARSSLIKICKNDDITKKFWLFNDDFYLLQPFTRTKPYHVGELHDHIERIEARHNNQRTGYTNQLRECERQLKAAGLTTVDYAIHVPLLVDRAKMLEALEAFPNCPMFRSLYGNYAHIGGTKRADVKINDPLTVPDETLDLLSSSDKSIRGEVGRFLAKRFPEPCRYEVKR